MVHAGTGRSGDPHGDTGGVDLTARQRELEARGLDREDLAGDPFEQFRRWFREAADAGIAQPEAVVLATADGHGRPSARHVLLKGVDDGFVFYTNYRSRKAAELEANPWAALCFPWIQLSRQVRVAGPVGRVSAAESDAYFATRPRPSRIGAWASRQSEVIADRAVLDGRVAEAEARFAGGPVPRPADWGGYRLIPVEFEFWQGRPSRLHDRFRYSRDGPADRTWRIERLSP